MKKIGEALRKARELQQRSLDDVATSTRISRKFLAEIEEGIHPNLPFTYVKAFIRDYANELGLNPEELLIELDKSKLPQTKTEGSFKQEEEKSDLTSSHKRAVTDKQTGKSPKQQFQILLIVALMIVIGFIVILVLLKKESPTSDVKEIAFSDVVKENEMRHGSKVSANDSSSRLTSALSKSTGKDSLFLEGVASESVWVKVVIDGVQSTEVILPPFHKKQWKAKKTFLLSLGNAAAVSFTLNNQKIGTLGVTKRVVKNVPISVETLEKFRKKTSP